MYGVTIEAHHAYVLIEVHCLAFSVFRFAHQDQVCNLPNSCTVSLAAVLTLVTPSQSRIRHHMLSPDDGLDLSCSLRHLARSFLGVLL